MSLILLALFLGMRRRLFFIGVRFETLPPFKMFLEMILSLMFVATVFVLEAV